MRVIVTGGNSGVGKATATALAGAGHSVTIACRDVEKAERVAAEMPGDVGVCALDLGDLDSVRAFADSVDTVDVLVNNAGVMGMPLADPDRRRLRRTHRDQSPRPLRVDLSARREDQGPGDLGRLRDVPVRPYRLRRFQLPQPQVLVVERLSAIQAGQPVVRARARHSRHPRLCVRSRCDRHRHHPVDGYRRTPADTSADADPRTRCSRQHSRR